MLCSDKKIKHYLMLTFGDLRRNLQTQIDTVIKMGCLNLNVMEATYSKLTIALYVMSVEQRSLYLNLTCYLIPCLFPQVFIRRKLV